MILLMSMMLIIPPAPHHENHAHRSHQGSTPRHPCFINQASQISVSSTPIPIPPSIYQSMFPLATASFSS